MLRVWNCLELQHNGWLVLLAGCVCFLTSFVAINLFQLARAVKGQSSLIWLVTSGAVTGSGVWATHFIAMLAYAPGLAIRYDLPYTIASLVVAILTTTAGFAVALRGRRGWDGIAGGALVGAGIACMHYLGMAALRIQAEVAWMPDLVAASVVCGIVLGAASLSVAQTADTRLRTANAACLLALAIVSHHFIAMGAIGLIPDAIVSDKQTALLSPVAMSLAIAAVAATVTLGGLIGAISDRRSRREINERNMQLDAALNNMGHGLCMFGPDGRLQLWNESYRNIYRIPATALMRGLTIEQIFDIRTAAGTIFTDIDQHRRDLSDVITNRKFASFEAELVDGRLVSITYRSMPNGGWVSTHEDVTERKLNEARIAHLEMHDAVTDLSNLAALDTHLAETLADGKPFALVRFDVDHFMDLNDAYGQAAGDSVLKQLADRLRTFSEDDFIARPAGDEFTVVSLLGPDNSADDICTRLSAMLASEIELNGETMQVGCTGGISLSPQDGADAQTLVNHANAALYRAKAAQRGSIQFFEAAMDQQVRERRELHRDLATAIDKNEFELYFQPQSTASGTFVAFEVLLRWRHPTRGLVSPGIFIPLAEEVGLIGAIDEWVLRRACQEAAGWTNRLAIAVNLSPVDFRRDDLPAMILQVLLETGLDPKRLEIEITEGVLIENFARASMILRGIKSLGVRIALDDFGTGYSSLSYLQSFPFDKIKIDQTFVAKLDNNVQSAAIIRAILGLGHSLKLPVIAEGVETREQLAFLASEGCDEVQGYLIGRPQPIAFYRNLVDGTERDATAIAIAS